MFTSTVFTPTISTKFKKDKQCIRNAPHEVPYDADEPINEIIPHFAPNRLNAAAPLFLPESRNTLQPETLGNEIQSVTTNHVIHPDYQADENDPPDIH